MARLNTGTRIHGSANVDGMLVVGQITPNNANVGLANTGSLQVWGGAYISGNTTIGGQSTTEQVYVQGNSNLLRFSQNFENAGWAKNTSFVRFGPSANTFAPDGTNTASQLINNTGGGDTGYMDQTIDTLNQNSPYTFSAFVKQGSSPFAQINLYAAGGGLNDATGNVNFSTGTAAFSGTNLINSTFVPVGGGWFRVSLTLNSLNQTRFINRLYMRGSGVAGEFGYFWGAQLEPGITPSAYANTSSGNIVKANNNLFVMGNTYIYSSNSSVSNTTGALVVGGGMGITGNLFMSAANNYFSTTSQVDSYRLGWADNYFTRSPVFNGLYFSGIFLAIRTGALYIEPASSFIARGVISNDQGNNTVIFASSSPVRLQNTAASTSNTTGALIVGGGVGVSGNVNVSNTINILSLGTENKPWTIQGGQSGVIGARMGAAEALDFYTVGFPMFFSTGGAARTQTQFTLTHTASAVNYLQVTGNTTGGSPVLSAQGSDTNVGINLTPKGSGTVNITSTLLSTSNTTGALRVSGGVGVSGNIFVGGTSAGPTGVYTDILRYSANGQPWSFGGGGGSIAITNDTTNSTTLFPLLSTANSGTLSTANTSNTKLFYVPSTGTLNATVFNSLSDAKYKENIIKITNAVNTINQIDGISFSWKENGLKSYGVIAQDIERILPELVSTAEGSKSVNYSGIIAFLINSVKELDARVKQLENK